MRTLDCYGTKGMWLAMIRGNRKSLTWRVWGKAMRRRFEKYLVDGGRIGVSKQGSTEVFMCIELAGVDFPRELSSMTDAEAVADGASPGQSAADWQSAVGNRQYFGKKWHKRAKYTVISFRYAGECDNRVRVGVHTHTQTRSHSLALTHTTTHDIHTDVWDW